MIVAGVMSGTSADGIDVAMVRIASARNEHAGGRRQGHHPSIKFLGHAAFPYPARVRRAVLDLMNSNCARVADIARLNFLLGDLYAKAVLATEKRFKIKAQLVGCHGQTVYHQGEAAKFLGSRIAVTWQLGEAALVATRVRVPVVSDFRPADMAVGGKGAPLVPYLDYFLYRDDRTGRIALNIGGIANVTAIPAGTRLDRVFAFDTGPGNMVIDALTERLFGTPYDRGGKIAARGRILENVVAKFAHQPFFRQKPPKTAGREEFGREFSQRFYEACRTGGASKKSGQRKAADANADAVATATALTSRVIADAIGRYVLPRGAFSELVASGGGTKNRTLMNWLANDVSRLGLRIRSSDEFGVPSEAKEAVAFAVMAFETWNRRPSNAPAATGARRPAVLGKVAYG